jgi:hypothetical protein
MKLVKQFVLASILFVEGACVAKLRFHKNAVDGNGNISTRDKQQPAFQVWYAAHTVGRGIWKWSNSLDAYQYQLAPFVNQHVKLMEVGVQSGGSIQMWQANLGPNCFNYGVDIDDRCTKFTDDRTSIFIGDQGKVEAWQHFFTHVTPTLTVAVDDGGHLAHQMLVTLQQVWPRLDSGGVFVTEDIHGMNMDYISGFFNPAADFLAAQGSQVTSVHIYPFMIIVRKAGGAALALPPSGATVDNWTSLMTALPHNRGKSVTLTNKNLGSFHTAAALKQAFQSFYELHGGAIQMTPKGCYDGARNKPCTMYIVNNEQQSLITAVHIFPEYVQVEVAAVPPTINAVRKGTDFLL